jgi:hypothetical protein
MHGDSAKTKYEVFTEASGEVGAGFTASALIQMLDLPVDIAAFYDGHPTNIFCTVFDRYGLPTKQYYAFDAFNKVAQTGERVRTECAVSGVYVTAAVSENNEKICILIANDNSQSGFFHYDIEGLQNDAEYLCETYMTDKYRAFDKVDERICAAADIRKHVYLYQHSFALICFTREARL